MKPVAQLIDSNVNGDCMRACIASILELDPNEMPNPADKAIWGDRYHGSVWDDYLEQFNLKLFCTLNGQAFWELPYFIWSIRSPKYEGQTHAVVASYGIEGGRDVLGDWRIAWDPSPWRDEPGRDEFYRKPLGAYFFVALDATKQVTIDSCCSNALTVAGETHRTTEGK